MDYKELIANLKKIENGLIEDDAPKCALVCTNAVAAIETLLTERNEAVEELRGICWCCAYGEKWDKAPAWSKMTTCEYMREQGALAISGGKRKCKHWKWRGVKKQD